MNHQPAGSVTTAYNGRFVFQQDPRFITSANVLRETSDQLFAHLSIDGADELREILRSSCL
jgi:hypothetical protein